MLQALEELAGFGVVLEVWQVDRADEQRAFADFGFEDEAELVVAVEVVDDVEDRAVVVCRFVEDDGAGVFDEVPPLTPTWAW